MKNVTLLGLVLALFTSNAGAIDWGLGVKAGTVGVGLDISVALTTTVNARLSLTNIDIEDESETITVGDDGATGDLDATLNFDYGATALFFDWYVFDGTFHLTAGMMKNDGKVAFSGILQDTITLDGETLTSADINGDIGGNISLGDSFQPYLGVGWGRKAGYDPGFSITVDLGVALLDPSVDLTAEVSGASAKSQADLDADMLALEADAESDLSQLEAFPILALGLNYAF